MRILFAVNNKQRNTWPVQYPLGEEREFGNVFQPFFETEFTKRVRASSDEVFVAKMCRRIAALVLPIWLKCIMDTTPPAYCGNQPFQFCVSYLGDPVSAEAHAHHPDTGSIYITPVLQVSNDGIIDTLCI